MSTNNTIPPEVAAWVDSHKGARIPEYVEGKFDSWSQSKTSACWGQPIGGIDIGKYRIAVCQPSPRGKGDPAPFWFDFIPNEEPAPKSYSPFEDSPEHHESFA